MIGCPCPCSNEVFSFQEGCQVGGLLKLGLRGSLAWSFSSAVFVVFFLFPNFSMFFFLYM